MKKSEVTKDQFNKWKDECRGLFKDKTDSMNLINICLKSLDETDSVQTTMNMNAQLFSFYCNDLARSGKLQCEHCGNDLEIYYEVHCFHCEECKPKAKNNEYNYFMCVKWLQNNEEDFFDDILWDYLCEGEYFRGNDSYMKMPDSADDNYDSDVQIKLLKKHFPENYVFYVSW